MNRAGRTTGLPQQLIVAAGLVALVAVLVTQNWLWRWDQVFYDAALRLEARESPADVIIVEIDDASLDAIGRWPWPRQVHAALVRRLREAGAAAIGFDVLFVESDPVSAAGDQALADAIRQSGRVVLPVSIERHQAGGQLIELMPFPALSEAARALGHVHVELDRDGLARSVFLREGLGTPYWEGFAVALLRLLDDDFDLPGVPQVQVERSARVLARDHPVLVPFHGPPGSFDRISYSRVLAGRYPADVFDGKVVFVGATATGLGDILPTPVSGHDTPMPGVELQANVFSALREGETIALLGSGPRLLLSVVFALLPLALYPRMSPRMGLLAAAALVAALGACSATLLYAGRIWFGPAPALLAVLSSYPIWSWLRLEYAMGYLTQEITRIHAEQAGFAVRRAADLVQSIAFIHAVLPVEAYVVFDAAGTRRAASGDLPRRPNWAGPPGIWSASADGLWATVAEADGSWRVGLRWSGRWPPEPAARELLDAAIHREPAVIDREPTTTIEVVQVRVGEMREASAQLRAMRRMIDDGLAQMEDGVLVTGRLGRVQLANPQAARFLHGEPGAGVIDESVLDLLARLETEEEEDWSATVARVLRDRSPVQVEARHPEGRDLLVQVAPLLRPDGGLSGTIVNLADISEIKDSERRRAEMLSFLSHDLRSPLVSAIALTRLAEDASDETELREVIAKVGAHTERTLRLAEQFLELARVEARREAPGEPVDLMTVALDAYDQVWAQADAKSIELDQHIDVDEAWVTGDASALERVFVNLLTNAVKYSPEGAEVGIELARAGDAIRCTVVDTGYGIAEADRARLFERYARVRRDEHAGEAGVGLGLAYVKATVDQHGGRIEVESTLNEGSRFNVYLPAVAPPA